MASAIDEVIKELDDVRKQLEGYQELKQREERLSQALAILQGSGPVAAGRPAVARARGSRRAGPIDEGQIIHAIHTYGEPAPAMEIRQALGLPDSASNSLSIKLKAMVDAGTLERIGERRASRYTVPS